jgi:large subunit ribosomal protein L17
MSLFIHQSIRTTKAKAKAVQPLVEKLITSAKSNTLAAKRQVYKILGDHKLVSLIFKEIAPRFISKGGYTRIINLGNRRGDNASMVILELTQVIKKEKKRPKKREASLEPIEDIPSAVKEKPVEEKKPKVVTAVEVKEKERPPITQKPTKKFFCGLRNILKRESRDSQ